MGVNYYEVLHLSRSATNADINKAYKKLSMKYHPDKNPGDQNAANMFLHIAEAYDVLIDPKRRAIYDQFGEEALKMGLPGANGQWDASFSFGYKFHGNAEKIFHDFYGGDEPFADFFEAAKSNYNKLCGGLHGRGTEKQDRHFETTLDLTLEEVFHGCTKKMPIYKRVMPKDGDVSSIRNQTLTIYVKRGWLPGTQVIFSNEADQFPNTNPGDIVYILRDKPHPRFRREGFNLIYVAKVSLAQALLGFVVTVQTLNDRILHIPITDIVSPGYTKTVAGEGMPLVCAPCNRGDLIIEFDIEFPTHLTSEQKNLLQKALLS